MKKNFVVFVTFAVLLFCSGCATVMKGGPDLPIYQSKVVETLVQKYSKPGAIIPTDPKEEVTKEKRNGIIEDLILLVDINYHQFESDFYVGRASFDTATDLAIISLGGAGALISSSNTKGLLAAISGGIGGARVSINKNFYQEQSANALISTMRASRKAKLTLIRGAESLNITDYSMSYALSDICDYYNAGTVVGAFQSIVSDAGNKEQTADSKIEKQVQNKIDVQFKTGPLQERILSWLDKDPKTNVPVFVKWLDSKTPKVSLSPGFWVSNATETELQDAILNFKIP